MTSPSYKDSSEEVGANPVTLAVQASIDFSGHLQELQGIELATKDHETKRQIADLIRRMEYSLNKLT